MDAVSVVWHRVLASQPAPDHTMALGTVAVAVALVVVRPAWRPAATS